MPLFKLIVLIVPENATHSLMSLADKQVSCFQMGYPLSTDTSFSQAQGDFHMAKNEILFVITFVEKFDVNQSTFLRMKSTFNRVMFGKTWSSWKCMFLKLWVTDCFLLGAIFVT